MSEDRPPQFKTDRAASRAVDQVSGVKPELVKAPLRAAKTRLVSLFGVEVNISLPSAAERPISGIDAGSELVSAETLDHADPFLGDTLASNDAQREPIPKSSAHLDPEYAAADNLDGEEGPIQDTLVSNGSKAVEADSQKNLQTLPVDRQAAAALEIERALAAAGERKPHQSDSLREALNSIKGTARGTDSLDGKLRFGDELGRGGMGFILKAVDQDLRRELAVKVLRAKENGPSRPQLVRFIEEAQITAQLEHPNIVPVHELGLDEQGRAYFTMKLVRGESLDSILSKRRKGDPKTLAQYGMRRLLDIFLSVCQAMEYAHARGVIHRDLKPANIMVGDFGEVLLMDWGLAKVGGQTSEHTHDEQLEYLDKEQVRTVRSDSSSHQTCAGEVLGTPPYMSPEQAQGMLHAVSEASDIYSLGAILYEILCGRPPFVGNTALAVLTQVVNDQPKRPSQLVGRNAVPPALEELVMTALEKRISKRSITIAQMRSHIQDHIEGIGTAYQRQTLPARAGWVLGSLLIFGFLVWYLSGLSVFALLDSTSAMTGLGWFLLVVSVGYPLWSFTKATRLARREANRFTPPDDEEVFCSGFLSYSRTATAIAPIFQLSILVEMSFWFMPALMHPRGLTSSGSGSFVQETLELLALESSKSLFILLVFLFLYVFMQLEEVRYARAIARYETLIRRSAWEVVWPLLLVFTLALVVVLMDITDWNLTQQRLTVMGYLEQRVFRTAGNILPVIKNAVFQGSFLLAFLAVTMLLAFPLSELLAALRIRVQPDDAAHVRTRRQYYLRTLAVYNVARFTCLYGGAFIGCLTAMNTLSFRGKGASVVFRLIEIVGPSVLGLMAFLWLTASLKITLGRNQSLAKLVQSRRRDSLLEEVKANQHLLISASRQKRLAQLLVPICCFGAYALLSTGTQLPGTLAEFFQPVHTMSRLVVVPYVLMKPAILFRDQLFQLYTKARLARYETTIRKSKLTATALLATLVLVMTSLGCGDEDSSASEDPDSGHPTSDLVSDGFEHEPNDSGPLPQPDLQAEDATHDDNSPDLDLYEPLDTSQDEAREDLPPLTPGERSVSGRAYFFDIDTSLRFVWLEEVEGAEVFLLEYPEVRMILAADGLFSFDSLPNDFDLTLAVTHRDFYPTLTATLHVGAEDLEGITFQVVSHTIASAIGLVLGADPYDPDFCQMATTVAAQGPSMDSIWAIGEPGVVAIIEPEVSPNQGPFYFNTLTHPDRALVETTVDGGVVLVGATPGVYRFNAEKEGVDFNSIVMTCVPGWATNASPPWGLQALE